MSLRSFRFYLSGYLHYYEHLRLPRQQLDVFCPVRVSHVHVLPSTHTQQNITPSSPAGFAVCRILFLFSTLSSLVSGFIIYGRLTTAVCVTKPDFCSLCVRALRALMYEFPPTLSQLLQPERQIWLIVTFIQLGIYY